MAETGVEVAEDADGESTEGVGDLGVGGEALGGEVVDDVAGEGDAEHDWHLLYSAMVYDNEADGERGDEDERVPPGRNSSAAGDVGGGVFVDAAVEGCSDRDAETKEEGVDYCIDHADGTGNDAFRLELKGAADCDDPR